MSAALITLLLFRLSKEERIFWQFIPSCWSSWCCCGPSGVDSFWRRGESSWFQKTEGKSCYPRLIILFAVVFAAVLFLEECHTNQMYQRFVWLAWNPVSFGPIQSNGRVRGQNVAPQWEYFFFSTRGCCWLGGVALFASIRQFIYQGQNGSQGSAKVFSQHFPT